MDDRVIVETCQVALGAVRVAPVGPLDGPPPLGADDTAGGGEVVGQEAAEDERPAVGLGKGDDAGRVGEAGELRRRDGRGADRVGRGVDPAHRALAVCGKARVVGPHEEVPGRDLDDRAGVGSVRRRRRGRCGSGAAVRT